MIRSVLTMVSLTTGVYAVVVAPSARADDSVTYEVLSGYIRTANVEYYDRSELVSLPGVPLPWRTNATVVNPSSPSVDGAMLRANWRPSGTHTGCEGPSCPNGTPVPPPSWVTIRIYVRGSLICESTLDVGNAACNGDTPFEGAPPPVKRG